MGIADRTGNALHPTNSIEAVLEPLQPPPKVLHGASPGPAPDAQSPSSSAPTRAAHAGKQPAGGADPESISRTYYVEEKGGERHYFDDYKRVSLAMRATDTSVSSSREDLNTIRAMFEIAQARGWRSVQIRGSAEFRREAWIEATARGLEGRGFAASALDRQEAERRRTERTSSNTIRAQAMAQQAAGGKSPRAAAKDRDKPTVAPADRPQAPAKVEPAKTLPKADKGSQTSPSPAESRKVLRDTEKELSQDGRLILAALSEKIDRQMNQHKAEMKVFVASELIKKERAEGPIVLSAEQKRTAAAEPAHAAPRPEPTLLAARRLEPEAPRRTLSR